MEQPGLVAAAATLAARASQRLRVSGFIGGMGRAATERPPKVRLALAAKQGLSVRLTCGRQRTGQRAAFIIATITVPCWEPSNLPLFLG